MERDRFRVAAWPRWKLAMSFGGAALLIAALGAVVGKALSIPSPPLLPPLSSSVTSVRATPNVLVAVRNLARLETASFHMERVIDLTEKQSQFFGLVESEDAILLVAVADVSAGVDLQKLTAADVKIDAARRVTVRLPPAEIFHTEIDNEKTYVHTRRTGVLARRAENLETRARREAERALRAAAEEAGILRHSRENARRVITTLVRSLGYDSVDVQIAD